MEDQYVVVFDWPEGYELFAGNGLGWVAGLRDARRFRSEEDAQAWLDKPMYQAHREYARIEAVSDLD